MNKKTRSYFLLLAVIAIWGTIGYKIVSGLSPDASVMAVEELHKNFMPKPPAIIKKFILHPVERDPFLGKLSEEKSNKPDTIISNSIDNDFPANEQIITFGGMVKSQNSLDQVFVVNIDNIQYIIKKGQIAADVKLVSGNANEIVINRYGKTQSIKRQ